MRWVANAFGLLGFIVSLPLWFSFDRSAAGFQFVEKADWIPSIGVSLLLRRRRDLRPPRSCSRRSSASIAILSSWTAITERVRAYYVFLLLLQSGMIGTSSARSTCSSSTCSGR